MKENIKSIITAIGFVLIMFLIYYIGYQEVLNAQLIKEMVLPLALLGSLSLVFQMKYFAYGVFISGIVALGYDAFVVKSFLPTANVTGIGITKILLIGVFISFSLELFITLVLPFTKRTRNK